MDLSRFPLLAQQHSWINSLQNLANRPLATVEHVIEPALLVTGLIARTPRGRRVTRKGYAHAKSFAVKLPVINWKKVEKMDSEISDEIATDQQ